MLFVLFWLQNYKKCRTNANFYRLLLVKRNWEGITKYISYFYLFFLVAPRDIIKNTIKGHFIHVKAIIKGICDFNNSQFSVLNSQFN